MSADIVYFQQGQLYLHLFQSNGNIPSCTTIRTQRAQAGCC